jgi:protocatechuate 3,4-dioxygenase alpha subunit
MPGVTPSQTIGPFFAVMTPLGSNLLVEPGSPDAILIHGQVFDGAGEPVADALIEIWQADLDGRYDHPDDRAFRGPASPPGFRGYGRQATGRDGAFSFVTVCPGAVAGFDERLQAPHITVSVFARGVLKRLATRLYFPGNGHANSLDPVLASIADPAFRETLIAVEDGPGRYRFDIHLRGDRETAFFAN